MSETLERTAEKEIEVLETIHHADENDSQVVQRDIAHIVGVSIGMTCPECGEKYIIKDSKLSLGE